MIETCASIDRLQAAIGFTPRVSLEDGLRHFTTWFKTYYRYP
jgi:UDP-glucuronate 4-epimerase